MANTYRVSFYLDENEYKRITELAENMTILRGIKTSVNDIAKSYVLKVMNQSE